MSSINLSASQRHPPRPHNNLLTDHAHRNLNDPCTNPVPPCSSLLRAKTRICSSELPSSIGGNATSTYWQDPVSGEFWGRRGRWCGHALQFTFMSRFSRPFWLEHSRRLIHFIRWRRWGMTRRGSGRDSTGRGSFRGGTTSCSFGFRANLRDGLFSTMAYLIYEYCLLKMV